MKIICAGYPKTGSKSCSTALRKLGYNVADYMETAEVGFQIEALMSTSDWLIFKRRRFDWPRVSLS